MGRSSRARFGKRATQVAALIALLVNLLVPQGFMTTASGASGGGPRIVLCTGSGPVMVAADLIGAGYDHAPAKAPAKADGPCAFSGHAAAPPLAEAPTLTALTIAWQVRAARRPLAPRWPTRPAAPPPPAIGPPLTLA